MTTQEMTAQPALEGYEFLKESYSQKRLQREARNILDSYSHTWDILAESLQNSVDAIEQTAKSNKEAVKQIRVVFNAHLRSVEVSDTGIGMSADQVMSVTVFKQNQVEIESVEPTETVFHGATHKAIFPNSYGFGAENTLHIIALKDLIELLKKAN